MQVTIIMDDGSVTKTYSAETEFLQDWLHLMAEVTRSEWTHVKSIAAEKRNGNMVWSQDEVVDWF